MTKPSTPRTVLGADDLDNVIGGTGLIASLQDQTIATGGGNDIISGGFGNDTITSGAGDDVIVDVVGNNAIDAGVGNDTVTAGAGRDVVFAGAGNDVVDGGGGNDRLWGGDGNDTLKGGDGSDTLTGGAGDDDLRGGAGNDVLDTRGGHDIASGDAGDDTFLWSHNSTGGLTKVSGGEGVDTISIGSLNGLEGSWQMVSDGSASYHIEGSDIVFDGPFKGTLTFLPASESNSFLPGQMFSSLQFDGIERISFKDGVPPISDQVSATARINYFGGHGDDVITGSAGTDYLRGEAGNDLIDGGDGGDHLIDGGGSDTIYGGGGNDMLYWTPDGSVDTFHGGSGCNGVIIDEKWLDQIVSATFPLPAPGQREVKCSSGEHTITLKDGSVLQMHNVFNITFQFSDSFSESCGDPGEIPA